MKHNHAIHLRALTDFTDDDGATRPAGAEWQLRGPLTYIPQPEVVSSSTQHIDSVNVHVFTMCILIQVNVIPQSKLSS